MISKHTKIVYLCKALLEMCVQWVLPLTSPLLSLFPLSFLPLFLIIRAVFSKCIGTRFILASGRGGREKRLVPMVQENWVRVTFNAVGYEKSEE